MSGCGAVVRRAAENVPDRKGRERGTTGNVCVGIPMTVLCLEKHMTFRPLSKVSPRDRHDTKLWCFHLFTIQEKHQRGNMFRLSTRGDLCFLSLWTWSRFWVWDTSWGLRWTRMLRECDESKMSNYVHRRAGRPRRRVSSLLQSLYGLVVG